MHRVAGDGTSSPRPCPLSNLAQPAVTILLVEDEPLVAEDLREHLVEAGYEVVLAGKGAEAMVALKGAPSRFDGLITDIQLSDNIRGWQVAHRARELNPNISVVYVTGDSAHEWSSEGVPKSTLVPKPFAVAQVITAMTNLLNEENAG